ncbi:uncharacterized protein K460DRAFT_419720 [Cucurbitaria berberidis CBS 394.84]|uniref:MARVEL domain-containing protein n=1 Tax=Cucurbitaria berberidis CBS 394.84 TaxID=1168544 RepID=A0A9P4G9M0_9PLEO|nr:uncharacterized protein K460DRAFT_419720 [Cucurbitaria berberidis CBS 394.84]KAF1841698.1 hypothetical protein K460DRAFT_419720 [Cucurbitaria berberidis CBS 394.84]
MSKTENERPAYLRLPVVLLRCAQLLLAIIVLGFDAYCIHYVAYSVLIYSLVVVLSTILVCTYLLTSQYILPKLNNVHVALGLQIWMLVFWSVDLGLLAYLANLWEHPRCAYGFEAESQCTTYARRAPSLHKRITASAKMYSAALIASAVLAAFEVILWIITNGILLRDVAMHHSTMSQQDGWRDAYVPRQHSPGVQLGSSQAHHEHWDTTSDTSIPRYTAQPILPSPEEPGDGQQSIYSQNSLTPESLSSSGPDRVRHLTSEPGSQQLRSNSGLHPEGSAIYKSSIVEPVETLPFFVPRRLHSLDDLFVINSSGSSLRDVDINSDRGESVCGVPATP